MPRSVDEAITAFRASDQPTIVGGGTIIVPDVHAGRHTPGRALLLPRVGLDFLSCSNGVISIGACVTLDRLASLVEPLGTVATQVANREIRAQATIGGNLCARSREAVPRGDLQVPLITLDARVRLVTTDAERTMPVEEFLADEDRRGLVLAVDIDEAARMTGTARLERPHTHSYTTLHVCTAATPAAGRLATVRVVVGGAEDVPMRLRAVEAALDGVPIADADPAAAASAAASGLRVRSDTLASTWYRERVLPVLVRRACLDMLGREEES